MASSPLERTTKWLVVAWVLLATGGEVWAMSDGWRPVAPLSAAAFLVAIALGFLGLPAVRLVLLFTYVYPVLIQLASGQWQAQLGVLWMAALLGAILPDTLAGGWRFSPRWKAPLVTWALVIVTGASIVALREFDFTWALVGVRDVSNSSIGGWPSYTVAWTTHVALVLLVGVLWFDWASGRPARELEGTVVVPLIVSFAASAALSIYQLFGDVSFLNPTVYAGMRRAGGGALDGNVSAIVAALWIGGVALLLPAPGRRRLFLTAGIVTAAWLVVWASGSRAALAAAVMITVVSLLALGVTWYRDGAHSLRWYKFVGIVVLVTLSLVVVGRTSGVVGPVSRVVETYRASGGSIRGLVTELWNRSGYGSTATGIIEQYPLFGIGVGSFHVMFSDFARLMHGPMVNPDNAQNWYRHQLAEFGLVGSLPWLLWVVLFAWFVGRTQLSSLVATWTGRAIMFAFAAVSLVGMPAQDLSVTITFWTVASWYVSRAAAPESERRPRAWQWAVAALVLVGYGWGTARLATGDLRVPVRAQRVGWPYAYGFSAVDHREGGAEVRRTDRHAVAVVEATGPWMELTVGPPGVGQQVAARVWCNGRLVVDMLLDGTGSITQRVQLDAADKFVLIELRASRPTGFAAEGADDLAPGLMLGWTFDDAQAQAD
jgi:hypothetical protein